MVVLASVGDLVSQKYKFTFLLARLNLFFTHKNRKNKSNFIWFLAQFFVGSSTYFSINSGICFIKSMKDTHLFGGICAAIKSFPRPFCIPPSFLNAFLNFKVS
jgi:hypothetical protein